MFGRRRKPAQLEAVGTVALATTARPVAWGTGHQRLAPVDWAPPTDIWSRDAAMSVPSVSRARDLICAAVSALPFQLLRYSFDTDGGTIEKASPPAGWMDRPDPNRTRQHILSWTTDDLIFYGRGYWQVTNRYADTRYPSAFRQLAAADVHVDATGQVRCAGRIIDPGDVVEFLSPCDGLLFDGWRAIQTALNLDSAAERFSTSEIPAGWLEQTENSEPMSAEDLTDIADTFAAARQSRTVAALNPYIRWRESSMDPARLQLVEARQHQALELARVANIPPYFIGAPAGGMTYLNAAQAKQDLIDYGAAPYITCLEQTLTGPNVTPHGQAVRLDLNAWLRNPYVADDNAAPTDLAIAYNDPPSADDPAGRGPGRPRDIDGRNEG